MLLVNKSKRLITINGAIDTDMGAYKSYQLRPGENPEPVEVPDELVKGDDVVKGWLKAGDLLVVMQDDEVSMDDLLVVMQDDEVSMDDLLVVMQDDEVSMDDLRAEAETLGIEVSKRWSRDTLVARIAEARGE